MTSKLTFWQRVVTPHQTGLASALARAGTQITYIAEQQLTQERLATGWEAIKPEGVALRLVESASDAVQTALSSDRECLHLTQGFVRNGYVGQVQRALQSDGRAFAVMVETIKNGGVGGWVRRSEYSRIARRQLLSPHFVLAIGDTTQQWLVDRGFSEETIYPFAYFIDADGSSSAPPRRVRIDQFRVGFVGQQTVNKRLDLLVDAIKSAKIPNVCLVVVGSGPEEERNRAYAFRQLGNPAVEWQGRLLHSNVPSVVRGLDCLVLPSKHDGWGVVVSEALIAGVPAICSDGCGAAAVVRASGVGGIFQSSNVATLVDLLHSEHAAVLDMERRSKLMSWAATSLTSSAGAAYLAQIIRHSNNGGIRPLPPWIDT